MRMLLRFLAIVLLALSAVDVDAASLPKAVKQFLKEVQEDPGLDERLPPSTARSIPFSFLQADGDVRLERARVAPSSGTGAVRFGEPGPWLVVYQPQTKRVIQAVRLPRESASHIETLRPGTSRMTGTRLDPRRLRRRLTLSVVEDAQIYLVENANQSRLLASNPVDLPAEETPFCPAIYRILGSADPAAATNLLVLPVGFQEAEMDVFRCAAHRMFSQLLGSATPFGEHAAEINVFRMDPPDSDIRSLRERLGCEASPVAWPSRATDCAELPAFLGTEWASATSTSSPPPPFSIELVRRGDGTGLCGTIFPSEDKGFDAIADAVGCLQTAQVDAVVVLANSGAYFGGGDFQTNPPTAVVSLNQVASMSEAWYLLAHELGHPLGLLDEYDYGTGLPDTLGRNVAFTASGPPVWQAHCPAHPANVASCSGTPPDDACEIFCTVPTPDGCCTGCDPHRAGQPDTGLWEGAQYTACRYFRSRERCLMRENPMMGFPPRVFCEACEDVMETTLDEWSASSLILASYYRSEPLPRGPGLFSLPGSGHDLPRGWDAVRSIVRIDSGIAAIAADRIEATVRPIRPDGARVKCTVRIEGADAPRCSMQCGDQAASAECSAAVEALVTDRDGLANARASRGRRSFRLEGIRLHKHASPRR